MKLKSYVAGAWVEGEGQGKVVVDAVRGEPVCEVTSAGIDMAEVMRYARDVGGTALRSMTFH